MAKLSPQNLGIWVNEALKNTEILKAENAAIKKELDELKEIVHKMLQTHHPEFRKKTVLEGVDDFLRNRSGRPRTTVEN